MPIEPVDPSKKTGGDGSEKYTPPKEKFGLSEYDKAAEKVKQENEKAKADAHKMAEEFRAKTEAERPRTYTERLQDMGRLPKPTGSGGGGSGGMGTGKMNRDISKLYKSGGKVKSASSRADGCAIRGKTKA
jgi:hypothetical protein